MSLRKKPNLDNDDNISNDNTGDQADKTIMQMLSVMLILKKKKKYASKIRSK